MERQPLKPSAKSTKSVSDQKCSYIASCKGPIILTAPHGCVMRKGGPDGT